jgi:hypothetical protein
MRDEDVVMFQPMKRPPADGTDVTDLAGVEFRYKFMAWDETWVDPDQCREFPLRQLAPDAVEFLAELRAFRFATSSSSPRCSAPTSVLRTESPFSGHTSTS